METMRRDTVKGFTLVEVMVVVIIIGILAGVGVPTYRSYVRKAMFSEGKALLGVIAASERMYYSKYGHYFGRFEENFTSESTEPDFEFDFSENKCFTAVSITSGDQDRQDFIAEARGTGEATGMSIKLSGIPNRLFPIQIKTPDNDWTNEQ